MHLESKAGTAQQSEAHKAFRRTVVLVGARYLVIQSMDDVARVLISSATTANLETLAEICGYE